SASSASAMAWRSPACSLKAGRTSESREPSMARSSRASVRWWETERFARKGGRCQGGCSGAVREAAAQGSVTGRIQGGFIVGHLPEQLQMGGVDEGTGTGCAAVVDDQAETVQLIETRSCRQRLHTLITDEVVLEIEPGELSDMR